MERRFFFNNFFWSSSSSCTSSYTYICFPVSALLHPQSRNLGPSRPRAKRRRPPARDPARVRGRPRRRRCRVAWPERAKCRRRRVGRRRLVRDQHTQMGRRHQGGGGGDQPVFQAQEKTRHPGVGSRPHPERLFYPWRWETLFFACNFVFCYLATFLFQTFRPPPSSASSATRGLSPLISRPNVGSPSDQAGCLAYLTPPPRLRHLQTRV